MKTIGIVEDDRLLNEALAKMLEKNGYQPLQAHTLEEGMKLIRQKPELIILDINLPDGEGTRICQAAREYSRIPVLFLTARDEEKDMIQAFDLGADDYLVKPFSMAVLLKHVEAVLRRTQGEKEVFLYRGLTIDPERKQVAREGEEIRVRDWGRGIEEGEENLVFGRFYRGKNVSGEKGFGLGLYLTREILHQHGGFLRLKRQEPGLSVSIYLPEE